MDITSQFFYLDTIINKSFLEAAHDFRHKGLHWSDVNYFKAFKVKGTILTSFLAQNLKDC